MIKKFAKFALVCMMLLLCFSLIVFYNRAFIFDQLLVFILGRQNLTIDFTRAHDETKGFARTLKLSDVSIKQGTKVVTKAKSVTLEYSLASIIKTFGLDITVNIHDATYQAIYFKELNLLCHYNLSQPFSSIFLTGQHIVLPATEAVGPLMIKHAECNLENNLKSYDINYCNLQGDVQLSMQGKFQLGADNQLSHIKLHSTIQNTPLLFYKTLLSVLVPKQITHNILKNNIITQGTITKGSLTISAESPDLNIFNAALQGAFLLNDVRIHYNEEFPDLAKANIKLTIEGPKFSVGILSGYIGESALHNAQGEMYWRGLDRSVLKILGKVSGAAHDLISFIPKEDVATLKSEGIDLQKVTGLAVTQIALNIPLAPRAPVTYEATTNINAVDLKLFNEHVRLQNFSLSGTSNNNYVRIKGQGKVNDFPAKLEYNYSEKAAFNNTLDVNVQLQPTKKDLYGIVISKGSTNLKLKYQANNKVSNLNISADLTNLALQVPALDLKKPLHQTGKLTVTQHALAKDKRKIFNIELSSLDGVVDKLYILGSAEIKPDYNIIELSKVRYNNNDLNLLLQQSPQKMDLTIVGKTIDLSAYDLERIFQGDNLGQQLQLNAQIERLMLHNNITLTDFTLNLNCKAGRCSQGNIKSKIGTRDVEIFINPGSQEEQWIVSSSNAGALLTATDLYKNVRAGNLTAIVTKKDSGTLVGEVKLEKFVTVDAPILTRMLSFISLSGLQKALLLRSQDKISFRNLNCNFIFERGIFSIQNLVAEGGYFDFTMSGSINTNTKMIKVQGNVMPSFYGISTIAKKAPVIEHIFSNIQRIFFYNFSQKY